MAKRYVQLLSYLAELDRLRTSTVSSVEEHHDRIDLTGLPSHSSVIWDAKDLSAFLVVTRCSTPDSPSCPKTLQNWIQYVPNQIAVEPSPYGIIYAEGQDLRWEEAGLSEQWDAWVDKWRSWARAAEPAFRARDLYVRLYDLHATLERNPEQLELVAADVAIAMEWVDHPILINPVRIELDVERSRITVGCLDEPAQVYGDAIRSVLPGAGDSIARARTEVANNPDIWAFGEEAVDLFATRFVQGADSNGEFIKGDRRRERLTARRTPWLLLRDRATGLAELAEGLKAKFEEDQEIPKPIQPILVDRQNENQGETQFHGQPDEDDQSYFTKPANAEQIAILRNYRQGGCVHVQGPPGTGKTHTIANLIGHFLAEGKSVLVTSEKAQALTVLREKVVDELRPLCVSLAGPETGEGLKAGMRGLFEKLGGSEPELLESEVDRLSAARLRTIQELRKARQTMRDIIEREHLPVEVRDWRGSPAVAGKYVNEHRKDHGWIPGMVLRESEPPLSQSEFGELLDLVTQFECNVVPEARKPLPPSAEVPSPDEFSALIGCLRDLSVVVLPKPAAPVPELTDLEGGAGEAERLLQDIESALQTHKDLSVSYRELANRVVETPTILQMWVSWADRAKTILEREQRITVQSAPYAFAISGDPLKVLQSAKQLLAHVCKSRRPIEKPRLLNRHDKYFFESVKARRQFGDEKSLSTLIQQMEFEEERDSFRSEVRSAAETYGLNSYKSGDSERQISRDSALQAALRWATHAYRPIVEKLPIVHQSANQTLHAPALLSGSGPADRMAWWLEHVVRPLIIRYTHSSQVAEKSESLRALKAKAKVWLDGETSKALEALSRSILDENLSDFQVAYEDVAELRSAAQPVQRRDTLLGRLRTGAAALAKGLDEDTIALSAIKGSLSDAWTFALIDQELQRRHSWSLPEAKEELDRLKMQLDQTTVKLASARAWVAQHRRVTQPVRSALSRFHEAQRRIGGGKGRRVPEFLRAMREAMKDAKDAFPVWIMPLHDLAKSFDFTKTKFDVVIVDESSQLSAIGLITLLIADSAIVVGDDEQTEPSLAGVSVDSVLSLIREHLTDFSDQILWSPDSSLYSFAGRFGATVGLREHFRCVPQIISFSSKLCYQSKIQALRESRDVVQVPHVVPVYCPGNGLEDLRKEVNEAEALQIASLIIACNEAPEYQAQTYGVIALRGSADSQGRDSQTERVSQLVREALGTSGWENFVSKTRFKTGVPPAFQGDERDLVFISVCDDPSRQGNNRAGPLSLLAQGTIPGEQFKKRLNVAVSRARNQVWIAHSFRHFEGELKETDLRRKLLEFAYAPEEWLASTIAVNPQAESPFEQAVYADLVRLGFSVTPQVAVGQYRIDLVAEDADARVAIECDGDAYHQDAAADLSRQIVLERCGWRFVRVRGSEYYRDPESAIQRIVRELEKLRVTPGDAQPLGSEPNGALLERIRARAQEIRADLIAGRSVSVANVDPIEEVNMPPFPSEGMAGDQTLTEFDQEADSSLYRSEVVVGPVSPHEKEVPATRDRLYAKSQSVQSQHDEYVAFVETGFEDPKILSQSEIQSDLAKIIAVEGPATEARIMDVYRIATGYGRFKGPTRERVISALRSVAEDGLIRAVPDFPGSEVTIYSLLDQPNVRLRKRGPRDLSDVPIGEIVALAAELFPAGVDDNDDSTFREILDFFDLRRLTEQARERLRNALFLAGRQKQDDPPADLGEDESPPA